MRNKLKSSEIGSVKVAYLRELQQEYGLQKLLDSLPMMVWMKDRQGRFLAGNRQLAQTLGANSVQDIKGKTDYDYFDPSMAQGFVDDDNDVISSGVDKVVDEKIHRVSGEVYWAHTHKSPVVMDGEVVGTVGVSRDATEERRIHIEKSVGEYKYRHLMESLSAALMVYDLDFRRIYVNRQYEKMVGLPAQFFLGTKPSENWSANIENLTAEQYEAFLLEAITTGKSVNFDMVAVHESSGSRVKNVKLMPQINHADEVIGVLALVDDVTELHAYKVKIEHMAYHDHLTGMANRAKLAEEAQKIKLNAKNTQQNIAIMVIDLDGLKEINDAMGHALGDCLLKEVGVRITQAHQQQHFAARLGGDEFAVLLEHVTEHAALAQLAKSLLHTISQPYEVGGVEYFLAASIGIAVYPEHTGEMDDLMQCADLAMYHAKGLGRNCYSFYSPDLAQNAHKKLVIETAIRRAIDKNEFRLAYQPLIDIASQKVVGVEALCRWKSAALGHVSPVDFIPVAERTGLIVALGWKLMREAFESACKINTLFYETLSHEKITVSVNVSARQFYEEDFIERVVALFEETQCQPAWIKVEITESLLLESKPMVLRALTALDALGVKISLDDFGTGQSALAYLQKFPIHQIKMDRSFVKEIHTHEESALLVKAIVALAASLKKETVAEGVETLEHQALLKSFGCPLGQGYLYSPAIPLNQLISFVQERNMTNSS